MEQCKDVVITDANVSSICLKIIIISRYELSSGKIWGEGVWGLCVLWFVIVQPVRRARDVALCLQYPLLPFIAFVCLFECCLIFRVNNYFDVEMVS